MTSTKETVFSSKLEFVERLSTNCGVLLLVQLNHFEWNAFV